MATVKDLLAGKGSGVLTIGRGGAGLGGATGVDDHKGGAVVVAEEARIVGMFTERDVLRRVVGERRDPAATAVGEVMTVEVACCTPETTVEEARGAMKNRRIRHLPVVNEEGRL